MGDQNKNVPRLRFPGYTDAWVKCTLGDLANFRRGSFPQPYGNDEWYDDIYGMPFVQVVDVDKNMQLVPTTKQRISKLAIPKSVFVSKGKIVVTLQGSIGRVAITQYDSYVDRTLLIFESYTNPVDEYFFAQVIQQLFEVEKERAPGGTIKTITKATLTNFQILLPKCEEQHKIGEFFKHLDNLITVNERELNKLKDLKKSYLEKMFPKNGSDIPELRFPGYADAWVKCELKNISENSFGGGTPKSDVNEYWNGNIPWLQSSNLKINDVTSVKFERFVSNLGIKNSATKLIPKESITIVTRVGVGKLALINEAFTTSQDFLSLSNLNINPTFGVYSIYQVLRKELSSIQGTSIKGITKNDILTKSIIVPVNRDEQTKIGKFFKQLDDLITVNERELNKLKELKKSYLKDMFV